MWKPEHRRAADRRGLRYPSDLTGPEWALVEPLVPAAKRGGRPRKVDVREVFALGVVGVGFLAVPVMTTGAAYDLVQGFGKSGSLHQSPTQAKFFYGTIVAVTIVAVLLNFLGFNPMRALVWSGIVQGFSVPPLLLLMMMMTNDRAVVGDRVNGRLTNLLGGITTLVTFAAAICLVVSWIL